MALLKMFSPRKPLVQLWNSVLTKLKDFLSWIKMLQFLINLPAKIREYFGWAKQAVSHATRRTTKALKRVSPGKFWIRPLNALSTQTWRCLGWLGAMLTFVVSGRHYLARRGKTFNFSEWIGSINTSVIAWAKSRSLGVVILVHSTLLTINLFVFAMAVMAMFILWPLALIRIMVLKMMRR